MGYDPESSTNHRRCYLAWALGNPLYSPRGIRPPYIRLSTRQNASFRRVRQSPQNQVLFIALQNFPGHHYPTNLGIIIHTPLISLRSSLILLISTKEGPYAARLQSCGLAAYSGLDSLQSAQGQDYTDGIDELTRETFVCDLWKRY